MSVLTNLAILAAVAGGTYYYAEYKPAKERKKERKKKAPTPTPTPTPPTGCPPGSQYNAQTGACEPLPSPTPSPEPEPTPLPPLPGPSEPLQPPPSPGELLSPTPQQEPEIREQLERVPTVLIVPFSGGPVFYAKTLPLLVQFAKQYPELQFVVIPAERHLGPMQSDIVMMDLGIKANDQPEGVTLFLGDEPPTAQEQLEQANEGITPNFEAININTSDPNALANALASSFESMLVRIKELKGLA